MTLPSELDKLPFCRVESAAFVCSRWGWLLESVLCVGKFGRVCDRGPVLLLVSNMSLVALSWDMCHL